MALAAAHPDWVVGFEDETWWGRLAQPSLFTWSTTPVRLDEKRPEMLDSKCKALACYGLLRSDQDRVLLRFVDGRPISHVTTEFMTWVTQCLAQEGKRVLVVVWDNAAWHVGREVRNWAREHNRRVKREGGIRLLLCRLPSRAP